MKPAIGGFCLGILFGLCIFPADMAERYMARTMCGLLFLGLLFAGIAWGFFS